MLITLLILLMLFLNIPIYQLLVPTYENFIKIQTYKLSHIINRIPGDLLIQSSKG